MAFHSILFERAEDRTEVAEAPAFFVDLNLDQIVDAVTLAKREYDLRPFFHTPLNDAGAIEYRHDVMRDLESRTLFDHIESFARRLGDMREHLAQEQKLHNKYQKESWFLDAVEIYCGAVNDLVGDLAAVSLRSRGLLAFREYLATYASSVGFVSLAAETKRLKADLATVRYSLLIKDSSITVRRYEGERDYSADVSATFEKFRQGAVESYLARFRDSADMNHVEAAVLDFVAQLHPDIFLHLDSYCANNADYLDETLAVFDREIQFYIAYLEYIATLKRAGLKFCYPRVSNERKEVYDYEGFDLALARKLIFEKSSVVCNDFHLHGKERIIVVTGPNQGGKTTFARAFGQLHYLASLGCPVPGREAQLFLFDRLFTHFEKEEDIQNLRGKLQDDLVRIYGILNQATSNSIVIVNEIFTSTTLQDAVFLGRKVMERMSRLDLLCVCVTFVDELASSSEKTVSMVSSVVPANPALRTYKIVRRPADGLAYAVTIAEKYGLTYDRVKERIKS